jgi:hypothetical protein
MEEIRMIFDTLKVSREGAVLFVDLAAPPMNLLGPELVRDLVSLIQRAEGDNAIKVLVFKSADPDYFIAHVDVTRIKEYRAEAAKLTGEASIGLISAISAQAVLLASRKSRAAFAPPAASLCWRATCVLPRESRRSSASQRRRRA